MNKSVESKDKIKKEFKNLTINLNKMEEAINKIMRQLQRTKMD